MSPLCYLEEFMSYNKKSQLWEGYIYIIRNDIHPEKYYIGQTYNTPAIRWGGHIHQTKPNNHTPTDKLHNAMNLYGINHFALDVIATYQRKTKEELIEILNEMEKYFIKRFDSYHNGYNGNLGGRDDNSHQMRRVCQYDTDNNYINTFESVDVLKEYLNIESVSSIYDCCSHNCKYAYGYIWQYEDDYTSLPILTKKEKEEARVRQLATQSIIKYDYRGNIIEKYSNIVDALYKNPQYTRSQIIKCCTGKRNHIDLFVFRFWLDEFDKYEIYDKKVKIVEKYNLDCVFIKAYVSAMEAEKDTGISRSQISEVCRHKLKTAGGYIWRYPNDHSDFVDLEHNKHCIKVYQYSKEGELLNTYLSIKEASEATGITPATISNNANGKIQSISQAYVWDFNILTKEQVLEKTISKHNKIIHRFDKNLNYIDSFVGGKEISKLFPEKPNAIQCIYNCCRGIKKSAYGFIWFYNGDPRCPDIKIA